MLSFRTIVTIDKSFRDLIKSGTYEKYVFTIINRSEKLFAGQHFTYNVAQSHGECDFVDDQGQKYDTKLVFNKKQGQLIGDPKNQIQDWLQAMMRTVGPDPFEELLIKYCNNIVRMEGRHLG